MSEEIVNKLSKLLESDEDFRKKFFSVFNTKEKIVLQITEAEKQSRGCHCYPYLCGKGCFYGPSMPYPNQGYTAG
jgi:hypothetical protein